VTKAQGMAVVMHLDHMGSLAGQNVKCGCFHSQKHASHVAQMNRPDAIMTNRLTVALSVMQNQQEQL